MKKVLIFSLNYFPKFVGGAEVSVKEITEHLQVYTNNNYEFHMITLRLDSDLPKYQFIHGIHIHRIGFASKGANIVDIKKFPLHINKYLFQILAVYKAVRLHLKHNFNFTWAVMAHSCGVPAGVFKMIFPKVIFTLNLQEGDPPEHVEQLARPFPRFLPFLNSISFWFFKNSFKRADVVFALSSYLKNWALKMGAKGKVYVVPNAVDYVRFSKNAGQSEILEVQNSIFQKKPGDIWLVTVSRLVYKNALDDVINSLVLLPENIKFCIVGVGPDEAILKDLVRRNNLNTVHSNRVVFAGEIDNKKIPAILQAGDIFIRPSRSEGFGISFIEAMAAGIPVIATLEGGISDFILDKETGYVCKKNEPLSISLAVNSIVQDPELKARVVYNAKKIVQEKYDWKIIVKQIEEKIFAVL